jgi:hypothetical protein
MASCFAGLPFQTNVGPLDLGGVDFAAGSVDSVGQDLWWMLGLLTKLSVPLLGAIVRMALIIARSTVA